MDNRIAGMLNFVVKTCSIVTMLMVTTSTYAQSYPIRPVRIITSEAGGSSDFMARLIAQGISGPLGQSVIVDNRGGGIIPAMATINSPPDGYTLFVMTGVVWIVPLLRPTPYDTLRDLAPITMAVSSPNILVVHPSLAVNSVKELIALAKEKPGTLNYSSGSVGSAPHMATELFKIMAGVNIVRIPYKSAGPAVTAVVGGQVQLMIATSSSIAPHIKSGRLRAIAVTSERPSEMFPTLPTVSASGLPGYRWDSMIAVFAPAKTPVAIVNHLNEEIVTMLNRPETKEKLFGAGLDIVGSSAAQSAVTIKDDIARVDKVIKEAGIHAD